MLHALTVARLNAQEAKVDHHNDIGRDTVKVNNLCSESIRCYENWDLDSALLLSRKALLLSEQIHFDIGAAKALNIIGATHFDLGHLDSALDYHERSLQLSLKIGALKIADEAYNNLARVHEAQGKYGLAFENFNKSYDMSVTRNDTSGQIVALCNLGDCCRQMGQFASAVDYFYRSLLLAEIQSDTSMIIYNHIGRAACYYFEDKPNLAFQEAKESKEFAMAKGDLQSTIKAYDLMSISFMDKEQFAAAINCSDSALKLMTISSDNMMIAGLYLNRGQIFNKMGMLDSAQYYNSLGLLISKKQEVPQTVSNAYMNIARDYLSGHDYQNAQMYSDSSIRLSIQTQNRIDLKNAYLLRSEIEKANESFETAFHYLELYALYSDSLLNDTIQNLIVKERESYLKRQDSLILAQEKQIRDEEISFLMKAIIAGVIFTSFVTFLWFRLRRLNKIIRNIVVSSMPESVGDELIKSKGKSPSLKNYGVASVLITDFVQFAENTRDQQSDELADDLQKYYSKFDEIMDHNGLERIKITGDSYMAVSGVPKSKNTHASDCIKAAIAILQAMPILNQQRQNDGKKPFQIRIGIHSGQVSAGFMKSSKVAYDIYGETVTIASRIEKGCLPDHVYISSDTYQLVKGDFNTAEPKIVDAKGLGVLEVFDIINN